MGILLLGDKAVC